MWSKQHVRFHTLTQNSFEIKYYQASYDPLQCNLREQKSKFNGRKINDTFTHTVVKRGLEKRRLIELLPMLFVSSPFFSSLVPFFFFFAVPNYRKLHLSRMSQASFSIILVLKFPCLHNERRLKKLSHVHHFFYASLYMTCMLLRSVVVDRSTLSFTCIQP